MDLVKIGKTIRFIRLSKKMSQDNLATRIELDRTYVSKSESGKQNLTLETLSSICDGLGISITDFFKLYKSLEDK